MNGRKSDARLPFTVEEAWFCERNVWGIFLAKQEKIEKDGII